MLGTTLVKVVQTKHLTEEDESASDEEALQSTYEYKYFDTGLVF